MVEWSLLLGFDFFLQYIPSDIIHLLKKEGHISCVAFKAFAESSYEYAFIIGKICIVVHGNPLNVKNF